MPAIRRTLTDFPPRRLYLDTNFVLNCLVSTYPYHTAAAAFLVNTVASGITTLYVSTLSWIEFTHVICLPDFRSHLLPDFQQHFRLHDWTELVVRDAYVNYWLEELQSLLNYFDWHEIDVTDDVRVHALQLLVTFRLKGLDATHIACAQALGITDIASFDSDFRRVDGLYLWTA
jgi:predicted nucleic acid-binding protein